MKLIVGSRVEFYQLDRFTGKGEIVGIGTIKGETVYDVQLDDGACHWGTFDQFKSLTLH